MSGPLPVAVEREPIVAWWLDRFGGPAAMFDGWRFFQRGRKLWLAAAATDVDRLGKVDGVGIPFARIDAVVWKPTTVATIQFGHLATRNVVEVSAGELRRLLDREALTLAPDDPRTKSASRGYVIARWRGVPVGCVHWRGGTLESCIPKGRMMSVLDLPGG